MAQWYLLKNSNGKKSVSYTMLVVTFFVLTLWLTLSMFESVFHADVREFDASAASLWFAPIAGLYFGRRWQKMGSDSSEENDKEKSPKT